MSRVGGLPGTALAVALLAAAAPATAAAQTTPRATAPALAAPVGLGAPSGISPSLAAPSLVAPSLRAPGRALHASLALELAPALDAGARPPWPSPSAEALRELRLEHHRERLTEGWVLLGWALANVAVGAVVAGVGRDDPFWLSNGLMNSGWGLVNGLLAIPLLDPGGARRRAIDDGSLRGATEPRAIALDGVEAELRSGQIFALNLGLDVFYVATGVLLMILGAEIEEEAMRGAGASVIGQGAFLLGFDLVNWIASNRRAGAYRALLEHAAP